MDNIRLNPFANSNNNNNNNRNNAPENGITNRITNFFGQYFQRNPVQNQPQAHQNQPRAHRIFNNNITPPDTLQGLYRQLEQTTENGPINFNDSGVSYLFLSDLTDFFSGLRQQTYFNEKELAHKLFYTFIDAGKIKKLQYCLSRILTIPRPIIDDNELEESLDQFFGVTPPRESLKFIKLHDAMIAQKYFQIIHYTSANEQPKELVALAKKMTLHNLLQEPLRKRKITTDQYMYLYQSLQEKLELPIDIAYEKPDIPNPFTEEDEKKIMIKISETYQNTMRTLPYDLNIVSVPNEFFDAFLIKRYPEFDEQIKEQKLIYKVTKRSLLGLDEERPEVIKFKSLANEYIIKLCQEAEPEEPFSGIKNAAQTS